MGVVTNVYGTNASDAVTYTKVIVSAGTVATAAHFTSLKTIINNECARRSLAGATTVRSTGNLVSAAGLLDLVNAIKRFDASATTHTKLNAALFNDYSNKVAMAGTVCVCNCNYCTCNCNYCTCNCNYCTCNCNYCTCNTQCP